MRMAISIIPSIIILAFQGKKQYSTTYSFDVTYPQIKSDIPARIEENGVVLFDPLNYNLPSARFEFQATRQYL